MITRLSASFLQTTAVAGAWAVDLFWYAGSLCLLLAQTLGEWLTRPLRRPAIVHELWKIVGGGKS